MILDNRQVVPDIVVSREGVPIRGNNYNINNYNVNHNSKQHGSPVNSGSPRRRGVQWRRDAPKICYVSGNNNGSPRHVPHNGNVYQETPMKAYQPQQFMGAPASPKAHPKSPLNLVTTNSYGSPSHRYHQPQNKFSSRDDSFINQNGNLAYDRQDASGYYSSISNETSPRQFSNSPNYGSPRRFFPSSPKHKPIYANHFQREKAVESPKRLPNRHFSQVRIPRFPDSIPRLGSGDYKSAFPQSPHHLTIKSNHFRPRSSSHPCENGANFNVAKSRIPVSNNQSRKTNDNPYDLRPCDNRPPPSPLRNLNSCRSPKIINGNKSPQAFRNGKLDNNSLSNDSNNWRPSNDTLTNFNEKTRKSSKGANSQQKSQKIPLPPGRRSSLEVPTLHELQQIRLKRNLEKRNTIGGNDWSNGCNSGGDSENSISWNADSEGDSEKAVFDFSERAIKKENGHLFSISSGRGSSDWTVSSEDDIEDEDSGVEDSSVTEKVIVIKCKDSNYLAKINVMKEGLNGLKVLGRVGGAKHGHVMSLDQLALGDLNSNHPPTFNDVIRATSGSEMMKIIGDVTSRQCDVIDDTISLISQGTDNEFEHEAADYQWLLDYDLPHSPLPSIPPPRRYRESYSRDGGISLSGSRPSVLSHRTGPDRTGPDSYDTFSRDIDANLAHIDMDDFRSEDIHHLLQIEQPATLFGSFTGSFIDQTELLETSASRLPPQSLRAMQHHQQLLLQQRLLKQRQIQEEQELLTSYHDHLQDSRSLQQEDEDGDNEEELSGVSNDISLYQSGPLFSPLKEPPAIPHSFSVDSLDSDSIHDDLILTCKANKDNYTIAFEGSYAQDSEGSEYCEQAESDGQAWSTDRLTGRSPAPTMTHSDQPYTTWCRVRRASQSKTPDHTPQRTPKHEKKHKSRKIQNQQAESNEADSKCSSMPNLLLRKSMRRSLEATKCVKVFDLQNSLRSSQHQAAHDVSLLKLFMRQKSLSREAVSLSSSFEPSNAGSSIVNRSENDSSDWPMNSQSDDTDGSSSSGPNTNLTALSANEKSIPRLSANIMNLNEEPSANRRSPDAFHNNNNNRILDTGGATHTNTKTSHIDNVTSFEDSLKDVLPCSKPPLTSPIREEPEGMDVSELKIKEKEANKPFVDNCRQNPSLTLKESSNIILNRNNIIPQENISCPATPRRSLRKDPTSHDQAPANRTRQDSGNNSSGYASNRGSTEKILRLSLKDEDGERHKCDKPKPKPRYLKQFSDQCLQTSNLKVSAAVNTSELLNNKEVYVYYPNYALPDLAFLKDKRYSTDAKVFLVPQHYCKKNKDATKKPKSRPFSCNDMEFLKRQGFSHVKDWESLNFLLPKELKEMLLDDTECMETTKPSFCATRRPKKESSQSQEEYSQENRESKGSCCSQSTQPSSGYRGSSTMLNDSDDSTLFEPPQQPIRNIPVPQEESNKQEPRPLPKGILRKCTSLKSDDSQRSKSGKRHSTGDSSNKGTLREDLLKRRSLQETSGNHLDDSMGCSCPNNCTGFCSKGLRRKNLLQLEELPEVSTHEDLSKEDIARLRAQVSRLLVAKGEAARSPSVPTDCDCQRKSVSFSRKRCEHQIYHDRKKDGAQTLDGLSCSGETPPMLYDALDKKTLVLSVRDAVEGLQIYFGKGKSKAEKQTLGTSSISPEVAHLALDKLCPALYALLSDGLLPSLQSLFGRVHNSVWRLIEASSSGGPSSGALHDLVLTLNSEELLSEGPMKFNAFVFGLLNLRSLDSWVSYLRTRESCLQKHFHPEAFLPLSSTLHRGLFNDLIASLKPLALLPFRLDLLHEYKTLDLSLRRMEASLDLLISEKESKERSNSSKQGRKRIMTAMGDGEGVVMRSRGGSPRPRSCHEQQSGQENFNDVQAALQKRWSGVQLGSKLLTAIDRLMGEDGFSGDYTDSLDNPRARQRVPLLEKQMDDSQASSRDVSERSTGSHGGGGSRTSKESEGERFRRLQLKWEQMSGKKSDSANSIPLLEWGTPGNSSYCSDTLSIKSPSSSTKSRIPRPVSVTSPLKPFKPFGLTSPKDSQKEPPRAAPRRSLKDKVVATGNVVAGRSVRSKISQSSRGVAQGGGSNVNRASSVPARAGSVSTGRYGLHAWDANDGSSKNKKVRSSSQGRRIRKQDETSVVQSIQHRLATDNGHLSFSRGDNLTVIIPVDERFLLCSINGRKGLVPRSAVVAVKN